MTETKSVPFLLICLLFALPVCAQETPSAALGAQYDSIAREIADSLRLGAGDRLTIAVEGSGNPTSAVNAFASVFQQRGIRVSLDEDTPPVLRITVLGEETAPPSVGGTVLLVLEARSEYANGDIRYWGRFRRTHERSGSSPFERIIEPLVVVAGSALIVYLFFTVRN